MIRRQDLQKLLDEWLPQQGEQFFNHLWGSATGFTDRQQTHHLIVLTAVASLTAQQPTISLSPIFDHLLPHMAEGEIHEAITNLYKIDTLMKSQEAYHIRIPLCRQWLLANYSLDRLLNQYGENHDAHQP